MPSFEIASEGSVPPVLFGICTAEWNPGAAGFAISADACRPTSEKTNRARRGRRRFSMRGLQPVGNGLWPLDDSQHSDRRCPEQRDRKPSLPETMPEPATRSFI